MITVSIIEFAERTHSDEFMPAIDVHLLTVFGVKRNHVSLSVELHVA